MSRQTVINYTVDSEGNAASGALLEPWNALISKAWILQKPTIEHFRHYWNGLRSLTVASYRHLRAICSIHRFSLAGSGQRRTVRERNRARLDRRQPAAKQTTDYERGRVCSGSGPLKGEAGCDQLDAMEESIQAAIEQMFWQVGRRDSMCFGVGRTAAKSSDSPDRDLRLDAQKRECNGLIVFHAGKALETALQVIYAKDQ